MDEAARDAARPRPAAARRCVPLLGAAVCVVLLSAWSLLPDYQLKELVKHGTFLMPASDHILTEEEKFKNALTAEGEGKMPGEWCYPGLPKQTKKPWHDLLEVKRAVHERFKKRFPRLPNIKYESRPHVNYYAEWTFLQDLLLNTTAHDTYFEWGSGKSSMVMPRVFNKLFSVENNPKYCEMSNDLLQPLIASGKFESHCVLTGKVHGFSYPRTEDKDLLRGYGMNYTGAITDIAKSHNLTSFDFIFIDGRWRACCAARAYPYLREDSVLLIHDYVNRKWHHKSVSE
eukprot:Selendium_serpulae@DN6306_c1_g1_i15.p1